MFHQNETPFYYIFIISDGSADARPFSEVLRATWWARSRVHGGCSANFHSFTSFHNYWFSEPKTLFLSSGLNSENSWSILDDRMHRPCFPACFSWSMAIDLAFEQWTLVYLRLRPRGWCETFQWTSSFICELMSRLDGGPWNWKISDPWRPMELGWTLRLRFGQGEPSWTGES